MNEKFKRRLIGLIVLLALLFALTWVLPRHAGDGDNAVPSTVVPLATQPLSGSSTPNQKSSSKTEGFNKTYEMGDAEGAAQIPPDERAQPGDAGKPESTIETTPAAKVPAIKSDTPAAPPVIVPKAKPVPPPPTVQIEKPASPPAISKSDRLEPFPVAPAEKPAAPVKAAITPPASATSMSPPVAAAVAKAAATAPDANIWYVQIGSFADQRNAQTALSLLQNIGYRGEATEISGAGGNTLYRVRLGPFPSEATARAAQDKVAHQGYPQSRAVVETSHGR